MGYVIVTRYCGPTDYRGSRIIGTGPAPHLAGAICDHGRAPLVATDRPVRATVPFSYEGPGVAGDPRRAAVAVADRLNAHGWSVRVSERSYTLPDGSGEVWPLLHDDEGGEK